MARVAWPNRDLEPHRTRQKILLSSLSAESDAETVRLARPRPQGNSCISSSSGLAPIRGRQVNKRPHKATARNSARPSRAAQKGSPRADAAGFDEIATD